MDRHQVIIALGTNTGHKSNMQRALDALKGIMTNIKYSRDLWTEPVGMESDKFLNKLISGFCTLCMKDLQARIKRIEYECGRSEEEQKAGIIRIDIDILEYDGHIEHAEDWNREYIKQLIKNM